MKIEFNIHFFKQTLSVIPKKVHQRVWKNLMEFLERYEYQKHDEIGHGFLKIRFEDKKALKGKSLRIICFFFVQNNALIPVTVYAKKDRETISFAELDQHLFAVEKELFQIF